MRSFIGFLLVVLATPLIGAQEPVNELVSEIEQLDLSALKPAERAELKLKLAEQLILVDRPELAESLQSEIVDIATRQNEPSLFAALCRHALAVEQFDRAERFAARSEENQPILNQSLVIEKIRTGDSEAFRQNPMKADDFYFAMDLSNAMVEAGDYEGAAKLVSNLQFVDDSNDPNAVVGFTYRNIADKYLEKGDLAAAKKYIDKAVEAAGNLYYTGYSIQIGRRVIYGELTKDFDKFVERAVRYRGHQARELLSLYAQALYENNKYAEAKQVIQKIEKQDDADYSLIHLARDQASKQFFDDAEITIGEIHKPAYRFRAKVFLCINLIEAGKTERANSVLDELEKDFEKLKDAKQRSDYFFAYALGCSNDLARIRKHINLQTDDEQKANWILAILKGMVKRDIYG